MQVFNLPHEIYCVASGKCICHEQTVTTVRENANTGERFPRSQIKRIAGSVTIVAGGESKELHESVLSIPEIKRAIGTGKIKTRTKPVAKKSQARNQRTNLSEEKIESPIEENN